MNEEKLLRVIAKLDAEKEILDCFVEFVIAHYESGINIIGIKNKLWYDFQKMLKPKGDKND